MTYQDPVEITDENGRKGTVYSHCAACRSELRYGDDLVSIEFRAEDGTLGADVMHRWCAESSPLCIDAPNRYM